MYAADLGNSLGIYLQKMQFNNLNARSALQPAYEPIIQFGDEVWGTLLTDNQDYRAELLEIIGDKKP